MPEVTGREVTVKHRDTGEMMTVSQAYYEKYAHKLEVVSEYWECRIRALNQIILPIH